MARFSFATVPLGDYVVSVEKAGFEDAQQTVTVYSGSSPTLHFQLNLSAVNQTASVTANAPGGAEKRRFCDAHIAGGTRADIAQTPARTVPTAWP